MKGKIIFQETQRFANTWRYYLIVAVFILSIISVSLLWYNTSSEESGDVIFTALFTWTTIGMVWWLLHQMTLIVKMDSNQIFYQFSPFIKQDKVLTKDMIESIVVKKYNFIENRGYGFKIRLFSKRKSLTITGNMGIDITFKNGKKLLLGTQKPLEAQKAIKTLQSNWQSAQD